MSGQVNIPILSTREGCECKWEVNGIFWMEGGEGGGGENLKQIPQPAGVTAESPGRKDQYGVIKAALFAGSLLLGTSSRPLFFHISGRFCPSCEGIAASLRRFLLAPAPKMLPVVGQLVESRATSLDALETDPWRFTSKPTSKVPVMPSKTR